MAVSAFKSTSKRGNFGTPSTVSGKENTEDLGKRIPQRRSRSVSAYSRNYTEHQTGAADFLNKRDNPLFCSTSSFPDSTEIGRENGDFKLKESKPEGFSGSGERIRGRSVSRAVGIGANTGSISSENGARRGRSVSRKQLPDPPKTSERSLSQVDYGRGRRSMSRVPCVNSESDIEVEPNLTGIIRTTQQANPYLDVQRQDSVNTSNVYDQDTFLQTWTSRYPPSQSFDGLTASLGVSNENNNGIPAFLYSEAEEKTIKAVFEQMKVQNHQGYSDGHPIGESGSGELYETVRLEVRRAVSEIRNDLESAIRKKNSVITAANVEDTSPESMNPEAIQLVADIRSEYAKKLEQSQERARILRADLAVEEQRGQELSRILKEILPDPQANNSMTQKSRQKRKTSIERRKMSRRLTEEAMNYFDECISISTFDSSDFSSPEESQSNSAIASAQTSGSRFYPCGVGSTNLTPLHPSALIHNDQEAANEAKTCFTHGGSELEVSSSSNSKLVNGGKHDAVWEIMNYVEKFGKEAQKKDSEKSGTVRSASFYEDEYSFSVSAEVLLFENVRLRNRISSGGLLLCGVGIF
ncbi:hypothetical protein AMTRI_Chr01g102970 [Amborella trichopoda]